MHHLDARHALEQLGGEMRGAADSGGAVAERVGIGLGMGDEFRQRLCRHGIVHHQGVRAYRDIDDRSQILRHVIGRRLVDGDCEREAARRVEERVAVSRGADHRLGPDDAGGSGAVLDHELLPPALAELLRQQTRHHIDAAAGRHRHDDAHRPVRIVGARHGDVARIHQQREQGAERSSHSLRLHCNPWAAQPELVVARLYSGNE
jgi:hypothetical protein